MTNIDQCREAFEKHIKAQEYAEAINLEWCFIEYVSFQTQVAFEAWQARAAVPIVLPEQLEKVSKDVGLWGLHEITRTRSVSDGYECFDVKEVNYHALTKLVTAYMESQGLVVAE